MVKTPHVGNNSINNLFAAQCGFPILWVDNTIPQKDTNANPHLFIKGGEARLLTHDTNLDRTLTSHAYVSHDRLLEHGFKAGAPLYEGHLGQMQKVFPGVEILLTSENFAKHRSLTETILETATNVLPHKWYRRIDENGALVEFKGDSDTGVRSWNDVKDHVYLLPKKDGWVIPNIFAILHDLVRQTLVSENAEAWMLSGPDMIQYLPTMLKELQLAYNAVRKQLDHFPEVTLNLVPFTNFRFVARKNAQGPMQDLYKMLVDNAGSQQKRADLATLCPDLWTNTKRRIYFSQHDMDSPDTIWAHEEALELPLREVEKLWLRARLDLPKELR